MNPPSVALAPTIDVRLTAAQWRRATLDQLASGLRSTPFETAPVWFYDEVGSRLFDEITRLPEYYPTRLERALLDTHADTIAGLAGADTLVELGSGTSEKTTILLDAMDNRGSLRRYIPFDVSEQTLIEAAERLSGRYPALAIHGVVGDFNHHLGAIPQGGGRLVSFLGGTIGNLRPAERHRFLSSLRSTMDSSDRLLLGADLVKDEGTLVAAYDDEAGVTAAFNRNALLVLNREAGADFDPNLFAHEAVWDPVNSWIEMRLRARSEHRVHLDAIDLSIDLAAGQHIRTEISSKFTPAGLTTELLGVGLVPEATFTAPDNGYLLILARPATS